MTRLEEIASPDFKHYLRDNNTCPCGWYTASQWTYGVRQAYRAHLLILRELLSPPDRLLLGQAVSPAGRSTWTVWIDHLGYDRPRQWEENNGDQRRAKYASDRAALIETINQGDNWQQSHITSYAWITAVNKSMGKDRVASYRTKLDAFMSGIGALSNRNDKMWDVTLFEEMGGEVSPPSLTPLNNLTELVKRSRNASGTSARLRRIQEIDEVLDMMEVLKGVRSELYSKVMLE